MSDQVSAYRWVLAWAVLALLLWGFSKLAIGYTILYYLAILVLLFLLVTQYQKLTWFLAPFSTLQPTEASQNTKGVQA
jgi:hypothetical protein